MDKLLSILRLEPWNGSRTKIGILIVGIASVLFDAGVIPAEWWAYVTKLAPYILAYFGIEHLDKYFKK